MDLFFVNQFEKRKHLLRAELQKSKCISVYKDLVKKLFELVILNAEKDESELDENFDNWDIEKINEIDDGHYQGTLLFIIPKNTYQPSVSDYCFTSVSYGSCSGCDTLQSIIYSYEYDDNEDELETYTEKQVDLLMLLALHLVQKLKFLHE
jgi:hypothetical protein